MLKSAVTPNIITYGSLLTAASHAGDERSLRKVGLSYLIMFLQCAL